MQLSPALFHTRFNAIHSEEYRVDSNMGPSLFSPALAITVEDSEKPFPPNGDDAWLNFILELNERFQSDEEKMVAFYVSMEGEPQPSVCVMGMSKFHTQLQLPSKEQEDVCCAVFSIAEPSIFQKVRETQKANF